jgi:hypothetical protein
MYFYIRRKLSLAQSHQKFQLLGRQRLGGSQFENSPGKKLVRLPSQQISQAWMAPVSNPSYWGGLGRRIAIWDQPRAKRDPSEK